MSATRPFLALALALLLSAAPARARNWTVDLRAPAPVFFGHGSATSSANSFKGAMDEIRVRDGAVSDDWAFAEYATVADPGFLSVPVSGVPTAIFLLE